MQPSNLRAPIQNAIGYIYEKAKNNNNKFPKPFLQQWP